VEVSEQDFGAVVVGVGGLLRRLAPPGDLERPALEVDPDVLARNACQLDDHPDEGIADDEVDRRGEGRLRKVTGRAARVDEIPQQPLDVALERKPNVFNVIAHDSTPRKGIGPEPIARN
jgi:hypothetical protein